MAILVQKSLQFTPLEVKTSTTVKAIGVKIICQNHNKINFISACVPKGNCETEDFAPLIHQASEFVTAGDFNDQHGEWETGTRPNKAGRSINEALIQEHNACLITPTDLGTRVNPLSDKAFTIDLTFTSPGLAATATIKLGPYLESDHFPIITTLHASANKTNGRPPSWILNLKRWAAFNQEIETHLEKKNFTTINVPDETMIIFTEALEADNNTNFKMVSPEGEARQEPRRPWWNEDCANLVKKRKEIIQCMEEISTVDESKTGVE